MPAPAVLTETRLTLNAATTRLGVSHATVRRWIASGVKAPGGVVRLESAKLGGVRLTSAEACDRFLSRLNPGPPERTPEQRKRAADAAQRKLEAMGC